MLEGFLQSFLANACLAVISVVSAPDLLAAASSASYLILSRSVCNA
jgi:hypothetical protein